MNLSLRSLSGALAVAAVALGAPALAPQGASAAVTCTPDLNHEAMIKLTAPGDQAVIAAQANGAITVNQVACSGATADNMNLIHVYDVSAGETQVEIDTSTRSFTPGWDDEDPGPLVDHTSEIEFDISLASASDTVVIKGHSAGESIVAGTNGVNMNAGDEPFNADADVSLLGWADSEMCRQVRLIWAPSCGHRRPARRGCVRA